MSEPVAWKTLQSRDDAAPPNAEPGLAPWATRVRWQIVVLMMAFSFMNYFNRQSMPVAADERIMAQYSITPKQIGAVYSAFLWTYTLFMVPGGWFVDRFGPKKTLTVLGFGSAAGVILTGMWGNAMLAAGGGLLALLIARGVFGVFSAPIYPACGRLVNHWVPRDHRALAMGLIVGSAPLGISSTFVIFGALIGRFDWTVAFVLAGLTTAGLAIVWTLLVTDDPKAHRRVNSLELALISGDNNAIPRSAVESDGQSPEREAEHGRGPLWRRLLTNRSMMLLTLSYVTVGYFEYLLFYWMHYYFESVLHLGVVESRFYAGIPPLAMAAGFPLAAAGRPIA